MRSLAPVVALAVLACSTETRDAGQLPESAGTTHAARTAAATASHPPPLPARFGDAARGVCDSVASLWRATTGTQVTVADSAATVVSSETPVGACHVMMVAPQGLTATAWKAGYWSDSTARGWHGMWRWDADGPDGFTRTLARVPVRCQVSFEQDGGDDEDSTYVPRPREAELTTCWFDPTGVTVRDTAQSL